MAEPNPFAFVLEKPRERLDRAFYAQAQTFDDIDDAMWRYLLDLVPSRGGSYESREARMLRTLSRPLATYFLVRKFDGEWGSEGMEGIFSSDDWEHWVPQAMEAFQSLGALRHARLIDEILPIAAQAKDCRTEAEQDEWSSRLQSFDQQWEKLAEAEDFFAILFEDIQRDVTPYLHPPES